MYLYRAPISDHQPTIHQVALVLIELRDLNVDELQVMEQFQAGGCNYTNSFQLQCSYYRDMRTCCAELSKDQRDCMVKLAMTSATSLTKYSTTRRQGRESTLTTTTKACTSVVLHVHPPVLAITSGKWKISGRADHVSV